MAVLGLWERVEPGSWSVSFTSVPMLETLLVKSHDKGLKVLPRGGRKIGERYVTVKALFDMVVGGLSVVREDLRQEDVVNVLIGESKYDFWCPKWISGDVKHGILWKGASRDLDLISESLDWLPVAGAVVDVGAGLGDRSVFWASHGHFVHVIDPDPMMLRVAATNFELNGLRGRGDFHKISSPGSQENSLTESDPSPPLFSAFTSSQEDRVLQIEGLDALGLGIVDLIKINIPGKEEEILSGAKDTIRRLRPAILVEKVDRNVLSALSDYLCEKEYFHWEYSAPSHSHIFVPVEKLSTAQLIAYSARSVAKSSDLKSELKQARTRPSGDRQGDVVNKQQLDTEREIPTGPESADISHDSPVFEILSSYRKLNALYTQYAEVMRAWLDTVNQELADSHEKVLSSSEGPSLLDESIANTKQADPFTRTGRLEQILSIFHTQLLEAKDSADRAEEGKSAAEELLVSERERIDRLEKQLENERLDRAVKAETALVLKKRESELTRQVEDQEDQLEMLQQKIAELQSKAVEEPETEMNSLTSVGEEDGQETGNQSADSQLRTMVNSLRILAHSRAEKTALLRTELIDSRKDMEHLEAENAKLRNQCDDQGKRLDELASSHKVAMGQMGRNETALKKENMRLQETEKKLRSELHRVRTSRTYQAGAMMRDSTGSMRGFFRAPRTFWEFMKLSRNSINDSNEHSAGSDHSQSETPTRNSNEEEQY